MNNIEKLLPLASIVLLKERGQKIDDWHTLIKKDDKRKWLNDQYEQHIVATEDEPYRTGVQLGSCSVSFDPGIGYKSNINEGIASLNQSPVQNWRLK